jgi:hypothetical protein
VPAWGWATVTESAIDGISVGQRFSGLVPMATTFGVSPMPARGGFRDETSRRRTLNPVYDRYAKVSRDADDDDLARDAALRPVFLLSFVLAEHLRRHAWFGASTVLVTSGSSKAVLGLAHLLADTPIEVHGLTSSRHLASVLGTGLFDTVTDYGSIAALPADRPTLLIDVADDPKMARTVAEHLDDALAHTEVVGATHPGGASEIDFSIPEHIQRLVADWERTDYDQRLGEALGSFIRATAGWLRVAHHHGPTAALAAHAEMATGTADPHTITIVRPTTDDNPG